ncbi:glycosyltransferase [Kordiimonas sp.]|uniref:glycosyltransferase n=1 Tax=Kordiimonas sp. TaxID=1970157 RepID=UPI003A918130
MPQNLSIVSCAMSPDYMHVRVQDPNDALAAVGCQVQTYSKNVSIPRLWPKNSIRIIVIQRAIFDRNTAMQILRLAFERDLLIVHEFDDHPDLLPPNVRQRFMSEMGLEMFEACHGVQTSVPMLAETFKKQNSFTAAFGNQIYRYPLTPKQESSNVRLLFGALNRRDAWAPLMDTFNAVIAKHNEVQVTVLQDQDFFHTLATSNKRLLQTPNYDDYLNAVLENDIVLMPLNETPFTACKSDVKFLEASICGAATIASPTIYKDTIVHGETGYIADTPDEWAVGLEKLITDTAYRQRMARNANRYVRENRMLMQHIHKRVDWYKELWENRAVINQRLRAQFPEAAS